MIRRILWLALLAFWLAAALIVRANLAAPEQVQLDAPSTLYRVGGEDGETSGDLPAAASVDVRVWEGVVREPGEGQSQADVLGILAGDLPSGGGAAAGVVPPLAAVTWSGIVNYAAPSLGRFYLAIPAGKGVRVRICGPAGCLDRTSTDAGPSLERQRAGKIADLNQTDWLKLSGVGLKYGGFQGTILVLKRAAHPLPATDAE